MHQSDQNTDRQPATLPHPQPQQPELMIDQFIQDVKFIGNQRYFLC